jgi:lipopolysaccharide cholinephosphotransferase
MREITDINEIKKIELNILVHFDEFCKQHGLRYFLAYGTLIGAIRHQGFIPWDDDIDVYMPRPDYNRLIAEYNKLNPNGRFRVVRPIEDLSPFSFVKFVDNHTVKIEGSCDYARGNMGIDIDVFPLDGQPESEEEFKAWYNKLYKIYALHLRSSIETRSTLKRRILVPLFRIAVGGRKRLLKKAARLHAKYPYENSKYVGSVECTANDMNDRYQKEWFSESTEVPFEDYTFPIPKGYDPILRKAFGNYMEPPPEEHRVSWHHARFYIQDGENND